jgi:hypothetical protein
LAYTWPSTPTTEDGASAASGLGQSTRAIRDTCAGGLSARYWIFQLKFLHSLAQMKSGFKSEPKEMAGTRNSIDKRQNPIPTRQIKSLLSIDFNQAFPSSTAIMTTPAIEAETAEDNARSVGTIR